MADLDSEFAVAEQTAEVRQKALQDLIQRQQADDRSRIAKIIVWSFVLLMAWVVVAATIASFRDWDSWVEPGKYLMIVLSSVMLPVVTLVIGYYFGKENK